MTIGTFAISALQEIRKVKGWDNAVIAGGFVRDYLLGGQFKDVDIFVPCSSLWEFRKVFGEKKKTNTFKLSSTTSTSIINTDSFDKFFSVPKEKAEEPALKIEGFSNFEFNDKNVSSGYSSKNINYFVDMVNCKYMGNIDVDIMAINLPNDENFGKAVVDSFNFDIDKVYFNGVESVTTKEHEKDAGFWTATLCKLDSFEYLPRAMDKFKRLQDKYKDLRFECSCLDIKGKEKKTVRKSSPKLDKLLAAERRVNPFFEDNDIFR